MASYRKRSLEAANAYLGKEYWPLWSQRFTVRPGQRRRMPIDL